ncbi:MAG TPA: hypothetical protein VL754_20505 [Verrucomicrobiae bacterium]|jgi:hypothetical protein|nr:hypothetical protein [Verrucomicrobiae bacterium]
MGVKFASRFPLIAFAIALPLATPTGMNRAAIAAAAGQPIAGIQCERQEYGDFHIHAHLDIFVDGRPYAVPALIGILESQRCLYWMHTHDDSGIIHIEAPRKRAFTVAQFLELWKATGFGAPERKEAPKIFVDGKRVNKRLDQVELEDHMEIALVYGKESPSIPSSYSFPKGA